MNKPKPCPECTKYDICLTLCPEVEAWANQDHRKLDHHERTSDKIDDFVQNDLVELEKAAEKTRKEKIFIMYYFEHKTQQEIADFMNVTKQYIYRVCEDILEKISLNKAHS